MKSIRIKYTAISKTGLNKFTTIAGGILQALEKNADIFNSPPVSTQALSEALKNLMHKEAIASDGSRNAKNERNLQKSVVLNMLMMTGAYIIAVANTKNTFEEKVAIVQLAGYPVADGPNRLIGPINPAHSLRAFTSHIPGLGIVDLRWKRGGKGAYWFNICCTQSNPGSPSTAWNTIGSCMNTKFRITGLKPGIWVFRIIAQGTAGPAVPSGHVTVVVG